MALLYFFFQAEDGIRDGHVTEFRRVLFRSALINLVKNSFEATESDTRLEVRSARNEKMAVIEIEDNGAGISEEVREKIFVPNFSTKSSGTGLGLAITKKIIVAHGGEITFRSEVGSGTIFTIRLPLANGSST